MQKAPHGLSPVTQEVELLVERVRRACSDHAEARRGRAVSNKKGRISVGMRMSLVLALCFAWRLG